MRNIVGKRNMDLLKETLVGEKGSYGLGKC